MLGPFVNLARFERAADFPADGRVMECTCCFPTDKEELLLRDSGLERPGANGRVMALGRAVSPLPCNKFSRLLEGLVLRPCCCCSFLG